MATFESKALSYDAIEIMMNYWKNNGGSSWAVVLTHSSGTVTSPAIPWTYPTSGISAFPVSMGATNDIVLAVPPGNTVTDITLYYGADIMHTVTGLTDVFTYGGNFVITQYDIAFDN